MSEKIGTKRLLLDKKIALAFVSSYNLASKDKGLALTKIKSPALAGLLKQGKETKNPSWRAPFYKVQTRKNVKLLLIRLLQRK